MSGWNVSREIAVVPVDPERVLPTFLAFWIGSAVSQRWLARVRKGVAYVGINIQDLRNLPVEVPPVEEQQEIVRRVSELFTYVDQLEGRYTAILKQFERITPALLTKAFRGELVPQNADDVPGSILVEHIRNTKSATGVSDRKRHRSAARRKHFQEQEPLMLNLEDIKPEHLTNILNESGPLEPAALWALSQLSIDDFYDQLKDEEARGLLLEHRDSLSSTSRHLVAVK
jgi:type I restriction enzyme S subunit